MITEGLQKFELGISYTLVEREEVLEHTFRTSKNNHLLHLEVLSLRAAHLLVSLAATVSEILTPRSTE